MENSPKCYLCHKTYTPQCVLNRHLREVHKLKVLPGGNLKCPLCTPKSFRVNRQASLRLHLEQTHGIKCERRNIKFTSYAVFQRWKTREQKETLYSYTKQTAKKTLAGEAERVYYHCHRSGHYRTKSTGERKLKVQGSNRIESTCPSMMVVTRETTGHTRVNYWKTHVGHRADLVHTVLPRRERARILGRRPCNIVPKVEADPAQRSEDPVATIQRLEAADEDGYGDENGRVRFRGLFDPSGAVVLTVTRVPEGAGDRLAVPAVGGGAASLPLDEGDGSTEEAVVGAAEALLGAARRAAGVDDIAGLEVLRLMADAAAILGQYEA